MLTTIKGAPIYFSNAHKDFHMLLTRLKNNFFVTNRKNARETL